MSSLVNRRSLVMLALWSLVAANWPTSSSAFAQELIGAKEAIQRITIRSREDETKDNDQSLEAVVKGLPKQLDALPPAQAAATWLTTYDRWLKSMRQEQQQVSWTEFIDSLPAPAAWDELVRRIDARPVNGDERQKIRALTLRMLGHRLTNQTDLLKQDVEQVTKLVQPQSVANKPAADASTVDQVLQSLDSDDANDWRSTVLENIHKVKSEFDPLFVVEVFRTELNAEKSEPNTQLAVPDLVRLIGKEAATPLIEKALLKDVELSFETGSYFTGAENETIKLARELARKHLKAIPQPRWELCHSIDSVDLFEAYTKIGQAKSRRPGNFRSDDQTATAWFVMGLIVQNRNQDAIKVLTANEGQNQFAARSMYLWEMILRKLEANGHAKKVQVFLVEALKASPELPLWELLVESSARLGQSRQVLPIVDAALVKPDLPRPVRQRIAKVRVDALLATDQVEDGIKQSLSLLADGAARGINEDGRQRFERALQVAEIGRLMKRDDWLKQGLQLAEKLLKDEEQGDLSSLIEKLVEVGPLGHAEKLLIDSLATANAPSDRRRGSGYFRSHGNSVESLSQLLQVYHQAGRATDVIQLLEEAPWWGRSDLKEFLQRHSDPTNSHRRIVGLPVPVIAAQSLVKVGRKDEARLIALAMVAAWPGYDPGWQLALELTGDEFVGIAERAVARDRYEERPLIWLARFHLDRKNAAKAEELIRKGIAIDPSDGEQGRGDRMRAYAILAEILKLKGDAKTAAIYDGAMKAIRLSEDADQFYHAGLLTRGIGMYRQSLTHFADAYCIQSRLAVQLAKAGDLDAAAVHYQRAFELMPDSFGRIESHCFGCEGVFEGALAEEIAERVFAKLVANQPKNPRVHYLLGYLRDQESRSSDALKSFREAVRLDPEYLNAWDKLLSADASAHPGLPPKERDEAIVAILKLDPEGRHAQAYIDRVHDLKLLATVLRENARQAVVPNATVFELKASKQTNAANDSRGHSFDWSHSERERNPFSEHNAIQALSGIFEIVRWDE